MITNVSYHLSRLSWIIYIFSIHTASFIMLNLLTALYWAPTCPVRYSELWFLCLYKPIFKISFLSLFPFLPQAVTSSSRHFFFYRGKALHHRGTLGLSTFCFSRLISHKAPSHFSSVGFTRAVSPDAHSVRHLSLLMHALFASAGAARFMLSVFCILPPCSCLHFPSTLKGLHYLSLKSIVFISPISSPKDLQILFYQHIICLSLSFFPETLLGG